MKFIEGAITATMLSIPMWWLIFNLVVWARTALIGWLT
jgi:hypothetical protein